ncbi:MAG: CBS domain-containing protein [Cyanobacteria bacterium P01_E01_bin.6]
MPHSEEPQKFKGKSQEAFPSSSALEPAIDKSPLTVTPDTPALDVISLMSYGSSRSLLPNKNSASMQPPVKWSSCALVVDKEKLVGILTERDVVKLAANGIDLATAQVADVMTQQLITLQESRLQDSFGALSVLRQHRIRHLPILNEHDQVVGLVTPNSIRHTLQPSDLFRLLQVNEMMSICVIDAPPETTALELAKLMTLHRVSCVVITQQRDASTASRLSPIGIVTERDIVQFQSLGLSLSTLQAQDVMSTPLTCLSSHDDLWAAHQTMERMRVRRLVVTNDQGLLVGIVTQTSILAAFDPVEMQKTIAVLKQQVKQLQTEQIQWLQTRASQLETQVQSTEHRFRAIFNQTFQFIGLLKSDGTVIEANQTALEFGGLRREDVIHRPFWDAR